MITIFKRNKSKELSKTRKKGWLILLRSIQYFLLGFGSLSLVVVLIVGWMYHYYMWGPGVMEMNESHPFRSEKMKDKYMSFYDKEAAGWPVGGEERMVPTSFGETFVRINGPKDAPPIILLPGGGTSSLIWVKNIQSLSKNYRVYALDNIYDFGRSIYSRKISKAEDFTAWLDELFTALKLENNINLIGYSYGGWITSRYLIDYPGRLNKVVLMAPAYTVYPCSTEFEKRALMGFIPIRYFAKNALEWMCADFTQTQEGKAIINKRNDEVQLSWQTFKFKIPPNMTVLTDEELQSITVPVLYLVGENEKLYSAEEAIERLNRIAPKIQTTVIPNTGHCMIYTHTDKINKEILKFLDQ